MHDSPRDDIPIARLRRAVDAGIITAAQLDALLATASQGPGSLGATTPRELRRGLDAISVAYWAGAIAVLFAFGWFLADRWLVLGPAGVLVVTVVYAGLFAATARLLSRTGFQAAAAIATVLVVGMVPVIAWATLALVGLWGLYDPGQRVDIAPAPWDTMRCLPIDLATILAALVAVRRCPFGALALPMAIAVWALLGHVSSAFIDPEAMAFMWSRVHLVAATALIGVAYALDAQRDENEDYAFWFYLVGLAALAVGLAGVWAEGKILVAHATLGIAILCGAAGIRLRRRVFVAFAGIGFLAYLGYLAFDVFQKTVGFPIVLATFGLVVILLTVLAQRRYPDLVRRMGEDRRAPPRIPGGRVIFTGAIAIGLTLFAVHVPVASEQAELRARGERIRIWQFHNRRKLDDARRKAGLPPVASPAILPRQHR